MNRAMREEHLALADRHVTEGAERIQRQREILGEMLRDNHPDAATKAALLLEQFEECQERFIADRDRLANELASQG